MRRVIAAISAVVLVAGCGQGQAENKPARPEPVVAGQQGADPFTWDFGKIDDRTPVKHSFVLENKTGKELEITGITNSCGCTTSAVANENIPPGGSTQVTVTFDPRGYFGPTSQYVYLNTDDPDQSVYRFTVTADVTAGAPSS